MPPQVPRPRQQNKPPQANDVSPEVCWTVGKRFGRSDRRTSRVARGPRRKGRASSALKRDVVAPQGAGLTADAHGPHHKGPTPILSMAS